MIADPFSDNMQFDDNTIQQRLDDSRIDVRYEGLTIAPSIVNAASTNNTPQTIFADYYSKYGYIEADVVLQGIDLNNNPWKVLTPVASELLLPTAHWQFEPSNLFTNGTVPGQLPPVFMTGKSFDVNCAAADLLEYWAVSLSSAYDISVDGQNLRRSQLMTAKFAAAEYYRKLARPKTGKMVREDVRAPVSSKKIRLLDDEDVYRGF